MEPDAAVLGPGVMSTQSRSPAETEGRERKPARDNSRLSFEHTFRSAEVPVINPNSYLLDERLKSQGTLQ